MPSVANSSPCKNLPSGYAGSTDMGNVSHRVPSIHPMLGVAPAGVIIHNPEFARYAASEKGDAGGDRRRQIARHDDARSDGGSRGDGEGTRRFRRDRGTFARARSPKSRETASAHAHHGGCGCAMSLWLCDRRDQRWPCRRGRRVRVRTACRGASMRRRCRSFETGARYHMYHALAIGLAALAMRDAAAGPATQQPPDFFSPASCSFPVPSIFLR